MNKQKGGQNNFKSLERDCSCCSKCFCFPTNTFWKFKGQIGSFGCKSGLRVFQCRFFALKSIWRNQKTIRGL